MKKNAQNALTSQYANGHGDPCDKTPQVNQVNFLKGLEFLSTCLQGVEKSQTLQKFTWWPVEASKCFLPTCHKGLHDHLRSVMSIPFFLIYLHFLGQLDNI